MNQKVQRRTEKRTDTTIEFVDKWKMVTSHTARRSFATNCYKMGVPTQTIMAITGHQTEKAFKKYIKLTKDEHATILKGYFDNQTVMRKSG